MKSCQPARDTSVCSVSEECSSHISSIYFGAIASPHMPAPIECENVAKFYTMQHLRTRMCGHVLGELEEKLSSLPSHVFPFV